ncbi:MAG: hypothetical protein ACD_20C00402G0024 [uncultured bacterium]|nr:MAG: hypothetical protein ACD_20C00402G0024 [uncultured bacterium]HBH18229.1 hypothetical protein [Cyanobacteria bacterium UBA9579]
MLNILLFLISFFLVSLSSLFFTFSLKEKRTSNLLIYFTLIFISQLIISFEVLSLLKSINISGVLICNTVFFMGAAVLWILRGKPVPKIEKLKDLSNRIINALATDRILMILSVFFVFCCLISLFYVIFVPTGNMDSLAYRIARTAFWVQNNTLAHFETTILSQTAYPINFELMILWPQVFFKRDYFSIFPAFFSLLASLSVIFIYLRNLKISLKRILWVIFIVGSLPIVVLESTSAQSDLFMGFLMFSSFYLFYLSVKNNEKLPMIFSAVAYAIALGTKSTAVILTPGLIAVFTLIAIKERKKDFYKPFINFIFYFMPAFLLLSAYNFILNYLSYNNIFGPTSFINDNALPGLKALIPSVILYITNFADFSGITAITTLNPQIHSSMLAFWNSLGVNLQSGIFLGEYNGLNTRIYEDYSSYGLLGCLLILPVTILALSKVNRKVKDRTFYLSICGIFIIVSIFILSLARGFSVWNYRYFASIIVLVAPILAFSYSKKDNFYKILIALIVVFHCIVISLFKDHKHFSDVISFIPKAGNFNEFRREFRLRDNYGYYTFFNLNFMKQLIPDNSRVGLVFSTDSMYPFFEENTTWKIYPVLYNRLFERKNFDDYDFLIVKDNIQTINPMIQDIVYNYYPDHSTNQIKFTNEVESIYLSTDFKILFKDNEGSPTRMLIMLEDENLLKHYDKLIELPIARDPSAPVSTVFRIYSKKH